MGLSSARFSLSGPSCVVRTLWEGRKTGAESARSLPSPALLRAASPLVVEPRWTAGELATASGGRGRAGLEVGAPGFLNPVALGVTVPARPSQGATLKSLADRGRGREGDPEPDRPRFLRGGYETTSQQPRRQRTKRVKCLG